MARKATPRLDPEQLAQRKRRRVLAGCLGVLALLIVVPASIGLVLYVRARSGPALPREVLRREAAAPRDGSAAPGGAPAVPGAVPAGTPPVGQQLARIEQASRSRSTNPQTLYVTDADLTAALSKGAGNNLRDVRAYFADDQAFLVGVVGFRGHDYSLTIACRPVLVNGALQFGVASVKLGKMSAPEAVRQRVQQEFGKRANLFEPDRTGLYIENVEIRDGAAVLSGRAVPRRQ